MTAFEEATGKKLDDAAKTANEELNRAKYRRQQVAKKPRANPES